MKKKILFASFCFCSVTIWSQEAVSTQGDSYSNTSGSIDYTIGEVVINTVSDGTNDITQGFHQTNWNFLSLEDNMPEMTVNVFPNPLTDVLMVQTKGFELIQLELFDNNGRIVYEGEMTSSSFPIPVSRLSSGNYNLKLSKNNTILKTFKLIKN